jgi:hypothetical protein
MKLLVVSFCFPPAAMPRSIQVARLLRHLCGVDTILVHGDDPTARFDPTIEPDAVDRIATRIRVPLPRRSWRRYVTAAAGRLKLPLWNRMPDAYRPWQRPAIEAIDAWWRQAGPPDLVATFGNPMTDHLVGLALARKYGVPWMAHFSDPWVDNPYHRQHALDFAVNLRLERAVVRRADRLGFPSQAMADFVLRRHPADARRKIFVLPAAFDPDFSARPISPSDAIVIRHVGEFYGPRTPRPLFDALRLLQHDDPRVLDDLRIELIGGAQPGAYESAGIREIRPGLIHAQGHVSHRESLELMSSADGLLLIDGPSDDRSIFLQSKLIEYVGVERPIFGIAPAGPATDLIEQLGGPTADPSDAQRVADELRGFIGLLRARRAERGPAWGTPQVRARFAAPEVAGVFRREAEALLASVAAPAPAGPLEVLA